MSHCKIYLDNNDGTYYAGYNITGRVECNFNSKTTVKGIKIKLTCNEHNEWRKMESRTSFDGKRRSELITYIGNNNILSVEHLLFGSHSAQYVLGQGKNIYPFSYLLPIDIPSSFSGPHGSISYKLKATVERPTLRFNYEDEVVLKVISPIDFNRMPLELEAPDYGSNEKTVCSLFCNGGKITLDVEISKRAFVVEELIPLKVHVSNMSSSNVKELKVYLERTITYKVFSPEEGTKTEKLRIFTYKDHGVQARNEHTFNLKLKIPENVVVPNFSRCNLFQASYMMKVSCIMPVCTWNLNVKMWDIELGHIQRRSQQVGSNVSEKIRFSDRPQSSISFKIPTQDLPPHSYDGVTYTKWNPAT